MSFEITIANQHFVQWPKLLELLHGAFSFQDNRINPPSSLHKLTPQTIAVKAQQETLFIAMKGEELIGCLFARAQDDGSLYVGKHAVWPHYQGQGIGSALMQQAEQYAQQKGVEYLELQVRIELLENQATFAALGFEETQRTIHAGFTEPTSVTMRKKLSRS